MLPVDFILHEYLHKYFENIKKLEDIFIRNVAWGPDIRDPPPLRSGGTGGSSSGSADFRRVIVTLKTTNQPNVVPTQN